MLYEVITQVSLVAVDRDDDQDPLEYSAGALDDVQVPVGRGIERTGKDGLDHGRTITAAPSGVKVALRPICVYHGAMDIARRLFLGMISSVLLALSLPNELFPWGSPALGLVALAPLFVALAETASYREAFAVGAVFGGLAHGVSSYWLWFFKDFRFS